jgi:long-chain acyl-CoA synthetase
MTETIGEILRPALASRPDDIAVIARSGQLTYAELDRAATAAAGALWQCGVRPGDRVAACLPNDLDIVLAFHGAQRIGAIWVGINESLTDREQQALAELSRPAVTLAGPRCALRGDSVVDAAAWAHLRAGASAPPRVDVDPHAPAGIAFTSGTTGVPKGIVHSQHNMLMPGAVLVSTRGWGPDLRKGDCLPLTLLNMQILATLLVAQAQGCLVLMDRRDAGGVAEWLGRERVNVWNGVPAQLHDLVRHPDLDLRGLQEVWCGGADCPEALRKSFEEVHKVPVRATYGLTEAPTMVAIDPVDGRIRPRASGLVLPHLDVAAYDDDGRRLPPGDTGELRIGPAVGGDWAGAWTPMLGEWRDGALTATTQVPLPTGDIGSVDGDGWLTVVDRKKLIIVRGGANVYPAEVERVIRLHPAVTSVAVFGIPDGRLGERVAALVQLGGPARAAATGDQETLGEIEELCRQELARYKVPDTWEAVEALPTNAMGKVVRTNLPSMLRSRTQA